MKKSNTKKLALAGVLCAVAVVGTCFLSLYLAASARRCSTGQCTVRRSAGALYGVGVAFCASLLRNLLALAA